jgi:hypothetical protein
MRNVVGVFENYAQAEEALERMCIAGLDRPKAKLSSTPADDRRCAIGNLVKGAAIGSLVGGTVGLIAAFEESWLPRIRPLAGYRYRLAIREPWTIAGIGAAAGALVGVLIAQLALVRNRRGEGRTSITVEVDSATEAAHFANLLEVEGAEDVSGGADRGNVEAAPEYEGARSEETVPGTEQKTRDGAND